MKKIFVITTHCSDEYCKEGNNYLYNCLNSLRTIQPEKVIVVDNQSIIRPVFDKFKDLNIDYTYIENQKERGLTGAWNVGINMAVSHGPALICNTNNDVEFDLSYNNLYDHILHDENSSSTIYGPKTNNPGWQSTQHVSNTNNYILSGKGPNVLNGFCLFFTTDFYHKCQKNGLFFSNEKENPWSGAENAMTKWVEERQATIKVLNNCFVYHKKEASWRKVYK